jgi:hypothetical protein
VKDCCANPASQGPRSFLSFGLVTFNAADLHTTQVCATHFSQNLRLAISRALIRMQCRNPEGCQTVAGGRSEAETPVSADRENGTLNGCQHSWHHRFLPPLSGESFVVACFRGHRVGPLSLARPPAILSQAFGLLSGLRPGCL